MKPENTSQENPTTSQEGPAAINNDSVFQNSNQRKAFLHVFESDNKCLYVYFNTPLEGANGFRAKYKALDPIYSCFGSASWNKLEWITIKTRNF